MLHRRQLIEVWGMRGWQWLCGGRGRLILKRVLLSICAGASNVVVVAVTAAPGQCFLGLLDLEGIATTRHGW
jgi:hypothetical protein